MVEGLFLFLSEDEIDCSVGLLGRFGFHDSYTIHDTMDMGIDPNVGHIIEDRENYLRSFDTNSWKSLEEFEIIGNDTIIFPCEPYSCREDIARLIAKKIHIFKILLERFYIHIQNITRFTNFRKKRWSNPIYLFIRSLC